MKKRLKKHLNRVHEIAIHKLANEVRRMASYRRMAKGFGAQHLAELREGHAQAVLFEGLRAEGYYCDAESNYFSPSTPGRQIDLGVWIPGVRRWLFLEVKPCGPLFGDAPVLADAQKLIHDDPSDTADTLRGCFAYGFRGPLLDSTKDRFPTKYKKMSRKIQKLGYTEIAVQRVTIVGSDFDYVQAGTWVIDSR